MKRKLPKQKRQKRSANTNSRRHATSPIFRRAASSDLPDIGRDGMVFVRTPEDGPDASTSAEIVKCISTIASPFRPLLVQTLAAVEWDAIQSGGGDPFDEMRASPLTNSCVPDDVFKHVLSTYWNAWLSLPEDCSSLDPRIDQTLMQELTDNFAGSGISFDVSTRPLSALAKHTLLAVMNIAHATTHDPNVRLGVIRRSLAHGRVLAMIDARVGKV